jgi:hypothetical protein
MRWCSYFAFLIFAHLARCAAAIFAFAAADIVRFPFRAPAVADASAFRPLIFAQRALCAAAILARAAAFNCRLPRPLLLPTYEPENAVSAALSFSTVLQRGLVPTAKSRLCPSSLLRAAIVAGHLRTLLRGQDLRLTRKDVALRYCFRLSRSRCSQKRILGREHHRTK